MMKRRRRVRGGGRRRRRGGGERGNKRMKVFELANHITRNLKKTDKEKNSRNEAKGQADRRIEGD
jgi:hypothetical protein